MAFGAFSCAASRDLLSHGDAAAVTPETNETGHKPTKERPYSLKEPSCLISNSNTCWKHSS
jgi:hypothetical protein